ncbi:MAG: hypothetical protein ACFFAU_01135 [Candidatus Hodarchaeota archaeon]
MSNYNQLNYCIDCRRKGIKTRINYRSKRCRSCSSRRNNIGRIFTEKSKDKIRNAINKHHIYLKGGRILYLKHENHELLHRYAYRYLVMKGLVEKYIRWFLRKYNVKTYTEKQYFNSKKIRGGK